MMGSLDVNRFAAFLESKGIAKHDTIAVLTTNSPEMVITILALIKIGAIAGLLNTNLRGMLLLDDVIFPLTIIR